MGRLYVQIPTNGVGNNVELFKYPDTLPYLAYEIAEVREARKEGKYGLENEAGRFTAYPLAKPVPGRDFTHFIRVPQDYLD